MEIIGACFQVHNSMGSGFLESVYQECLRIEFQRSRIPFQEQPQLKLQYAGVELKQTYQPDFICYGKIVLELKSVKQLCDEHRAQTLNYLKATGLALGLLVNFGSHPKLEYERFLNQKHSNYSHHS